MSVLVANTSVSATSLSYEEIQRRKATELPRIRLDTNEDEVRVPARQSPQMRRCPHCNSDVKELLMSSSADLWSENGDTPRHGRRAEWFLPNRLRVIRRRRTSGNIIHWSTKRKKIRENSSSKEVSKTLRPHLRHKRNHEEEQRRLGNRWDGHAGAGVFSHEQKNLARYRC
jgi:hypothetical protein